MCRSLLERIDDRLGFLPPTAAEVYTVPVGCRRRLSLQSVNARVEVSSRVIRTDHRQPSTDS
jgi:hypothetical protein